MIDRIFQEIRQERKRQDEKWGEQNHPMVPGDFDYGLCKETLDELRHANDSGDKNCWQYILLEELLEACMETDPKKQREEMIQVAAVAVQAIECLDRKKGGWK